MKCLSKAWHIICAQEALIIISQPWAMHEFLLAHLPPGGESYNPVSTKGPKRTGLLGGNLAGEKS